MKTHIPRAELKAHFARRIAELASGDFLGRALGEKASAKGGGVEIETIQNDGTGPATLALRSKAQGDFRGDFIAKLFADGSGGHSWQVLSQLWRSGFGEGEKHRVPEPLFFDPERNLIVMRRAPGACLDGSLGADLPSAREGVRKAARWLLHLHASPIRAGIPEGPWYIFGKLADRLSKAAAEHPGRLDLLNELVDELSAALEAREQVPFVQTHGQYRPIHVFIAEDSTTVIDLDRTAPADPARDAAEFVHRLRSGVHRRGGTIEQANALTRSFMDEYGSGNPRGLKNLTFFLCAQVMASLCRHMKRLPAGHPDLEATIRHYRREMPSSLPAAGVL